MPRGQSDGGSTYPKSSEDDGYEFSSVRPTVRPGVIGAGRDFVVARLAPHADHGNYRYAPVRGPVPNLVSDRPRSVAGAPRTRRVSTGAYKHHAVLGQNRKDWYVLMYLG